MGHGLVIDREDPVPRNRKLAWTAVLILLAVLTYGRLTERLVGPLGFDGLQSEAASYLGDVRKRALDVFLAARASTGIISVIESIQAGPVVVEGKPGMLLEPVREVVDQLGEMMTISVVTLEALELLREVGIKISFTAFIPLGFLVLAIGLWLRAGRFAVISLGKGLLLAGIMLSIGLPLTIWAEEGLSRSLLHEQYEAAYRNVSQMQSGLGEHLAGPDKQSAAPDAAAPPQTPSLFSRATDWLANAFSAARAAADQNGMQDLSRWLNDKIESVLKLMTIFLVEVFLLPTLLGYAIYRGLRSMMVRVVTVGRDAA